MRPTLASWPVVAARTPPPSSRTTSRYPLPVSILMWEMCFLPLLRATLSERYASAASIAPTRSLSTPGSCEEEMRSRSPERTAHDSMSSESALRSASTRSRSCAIPALLPSAISISRPLFAAEAGIISECHHSPKELNRSPGNGIFTAPGAIRSAGERYLHTTTKSAKSRLTSFCSTRHKVHVTTSSCQPSCRRVDGTVRDQDGTPRVGGRQEARPLSRTLTAYHKAGHEVVSTLLQRIAMTLTRMDATQHTPRCALVLIYG